MSNWPLAVRLETLPGDGVVDRFANAKRYGFDAVELPGRYLDEYRDDLMRNADRLPLPVSSISLGFRGSLVSADPASRAQCRADTMELLGLCRQLDACGLVMPPILNRDTHERVTAAPEGRTIKELLDELLIEQLPQLAGCAAENGVHLMIEPINALETDYLVTVEDAVSILDRVDCDGLGITVDFFHMQLSQLKIDSAIRDAARWVRHVHVAENTGVEPGPGSLDFSPGFAALREIGYDGYVVIECRSLSGEPDTVLPRSEQYMRALISG